MATRSANPLSIPEVGEDFVVEVRSETPFLPKIAFGVITLASLGGAIFTGRSLGVPSSLIGLRWLSMWMVALVVGFSAWRAFYLRVEEGGLNPQRVEALATSSFSRSRLIERLLATGIALTAPVPWLLDYLAGGVARWALTIAAGVQVVSLWRGLKSRRNAIAGLAAGAVATVAWGMSSTGGGFPGAVRSLHLLAFGLWLGGALWNLGVAIPAGRENPLIDAVVAAARQLQRFRWVVRFALHTVIVTGLIQADVYRHLEASWWLSFPGVLIPLKLVFIVALVVIFITCPLYRQCSPVTGVCRIDDVHREGVR